MKDSILNVSAVSRSHQNSLEEAIFSTVAYRDVFDFPLSLDEIHRYLHWHRCSAAEVAEALEATDLCHGRLKTDGTFYCLAQRRTVLQGRLEREERAQRTLLTAQKVARQLAYLPHIKMVALTGSLAARNGYKGADIDFLCVTNEGRMWQSRALVLVAKRIDAMTRKRKICPNFFMSTAALEFDVQSMYVAQELAQMVPIYGRETYDQMRRINSWSSDFLPNAADPPPNSDALSISVSETLKAPLQSLYGTLVGTWLEPWERSRKLLRFNAAHYNDGTYSAFSSERTGHDTTTGQRIEAAWNKHLAAQPTGLRHQDTPETAPALIGAT